MKLSQIYSEFFTNWLTDGFFINKDKISSVGIKPGFDRIFTKGYIRKIWVVEKIPVTYEINLVEALRDHMFEEFPNCKTYINILNCPTTIQTNSDTFKRSMHKAEDDYSAYKQVFDSLSGTEKVVGKDLRISSSKKITIKKSRLQKYKNTYDSYEYVYKGTVSGMTFSKSTIVIEALCPDERSMRAYKKEMNCFLRNNEIEYKEMRGTISKFLTNYGISSYMQKGSRQSGVLFSDENLASFSTYRNRGLVGGEGLLLGIDWKTKLPFLVNFFESGAGQILMLLARTGSGKTFVAFQMCLSLIAEGVHCSVIDIKGNEWIKLKRFIDKIESRKGKTARKAKVLYFAMGSTSSRFVNTLRLDDVTPDKKDCKEFYNMAVSGTINILSIMTNLQPGEGNIIDLENILEQAIGKLYSKYGVFNDRPETFAKTKGIRYEEIVPIITELQNSTSYTDEQRKMCKLICSRCSNFLQAEGKYSEAFKNEITLGEVLDSDLVIYSFGKNENQLLDSMDSLRVFMVQFLDTKKQAMRKKRKQHTAAFYEELQRCEQFGRLVTYISHSVTGSRSNNVMIILLLNDMSVLNQKDFLAIRSNITTKIMGKLNEQDIVEVSNHYDCRDIAKELDLIRQDEKYQNCFAIKYDTGKHRDKTVFKVTLPTEMEKYFSTRDVKK